MMVAQLVSTMLISVLWTFVRGCQWADVFSIRLPCIVHLFGVMFALMGLSVSFVNVQVAVEIPEVI